MRDRATFSRVLLVLAGTVVVLVGMRLAAPVLNPITLFVAVMLNTFPETRWLASFMGIRSPDAKAET